MSSVVHKILFLQAIFRKRFFYKGTNLRQFIKSRTHKLKVNSLYFLSFFSLLSFRPNINFSVLPVHNDAKNLIAVSTFHTASCHF